jgi:hypothetical protein
MLAKAPQQSFPTPGSKAYDARRKRLDRVSPARNMAALWRNVPSNLTGDLPHESRTLGQETLPPRDLGGRSARGDLYSIIAVRFRLLRIFKVGAGCTYGGRH